MTPDRDSPIDRDPRWRTALTETLRAQQVGVTRDLILRALTELVTEEGVADFSVQQVADRAGVSHRTVYRHFPSREALLDGLADWVDDQLRERGLPAFPDGLERLPELVEEVYAAFGDLSDLMHALVTVAAGARVQLTSRQRRTIAFRELLAAEATGHLEPAAAETAVTVVRALGSSTLWHVLTAHLGLDSQSAGRGVSWLLRLAIDDLHGGGGPAGDDEEART